MKSDIPGLTPIWVIDLKRKANNNLKTKGDRVSNDINTLCSSLQEHCKNASDQAKNCKEKSLEIQAEIHHLHDVINEFRNMLEKFYEEPPPSSPHSEEDKAA